MTAVRPFANAQEVASLIDHTLLKSDATSAAIETLCEQALEFKFAAVCVNPCWVSAVHPRLSRSAVRTCSVVGFPLGANTTGAKLNEARIALAEGASEIDMVINVGALLSGQADFVGREIKELAEIAHSSDAGIKVILETCLLNDDQKTLVCRLSKDADVDFVKTSTGFSTSGATEADVALMAAAVGPKIRVKASGGIRTLDSLTKMVRAGATRIGTSAGVHIIAEFRAGADPSTNPAAGDGGAY